MINLEKNSLEQNLFAAINELKPQIELLAGSSDFLTKRKTSALAEKVKTAVQTYLQQSDHSLLSWDTSNRIAMVMGDCRNLMKRINFTRTDFLGRSRLSNTEKQLKEAFQAIESIPQMPQPLPEPQPLPQRQPHSKTQKEFQTLDELNNHFIGLRDEIRLKTQHLIIEFLNKKFNFPKENIKIFPTKHAAFNFDFKLTENFSKRPEFENDPEFLDILNNGNKEMESLKKEKMYQEMKFEMAEESRILAESFAPAKGRPELNRMF